MARQQHTRPNTPVRQSRAFIRKERKTSKDSSHLHHRRNGKKNRVEERVEPDDNGAAKHNHRRPHRYIRSVNLHKPTLVTLTHARKSTSIHHADEETTL
ncbi:hypothetical protein YC2023_067670 [Brassica napus]